MATAVAAWRVTCRIIRLSRSDYLARLAADYKDLPGGFDGIGRDGVEVVDSHDACDLAHQSFYESEVATGDAKVATTDSASAGRCGS